MINNNSNNICISSSINISNSIINISIIYISIINMNNYISVLISNISMNIYIHIIIIFNINITIININNNNSKSKNSKNENLKNAVTHKFVFNACRATLASSFPSHRKTKTTVTLGQTYKTFLLFYYTPK
jgi:hypothetical protein